jgi:diacylglycerol kinase
VFEESIWALCAALLVGSAIVLWPRRRRQARLSIAAACVLGVGYVAYMAGVDVPMYWARWVADMEHGRRYLGLDEGLADMASRWIVTHRWLDWHSEVVWMTLYFSVGVWISIGLMHLPARLGLGAAKKPEGTTEGVAMTTMKSTTAFSFLRVVRAVQFSEQGFRSAWRDEAAFRQELACMALVLAAELLNSGVEAVVDMATPEYHVLAAKAKDCGSAAVFVALLTLGGAWLWLAGPALWARLFH